MANIISLQFSDQVETVTGRLDYTGDETDNSDIDYWIGTEGYSIPYVDIKGNLEVSTSSKLTTAWNRNTFGDSSATISSTETWAYSKYVMLPSSISLAIRSGASNGVCNFVLEVENETGAYEVIGTFNPNLTTGFGYFNFPVLSKFWSKSFRFRRLAGQTVRIDEVFMYGSFRREDRASLGLFPANSSVETVKDSQLSINSINGPLDYQGQLSSKANTILTTERVTLTGNLTIDNQGTNLIVSVDPNGLNRSVILPQLPRLDHYIRLINVDGSNLINVRETIEGPVIQELSNSSTVLTVECIWDQEDSTWHLTA